MYWDSEATDKGFPFLDWRDQIRLVLRVFLFHRQPSLQLEQIFIDLGGAPEPPQQRSKSCNQLVLDR